MRRTLAGSMLALIVVAVAGTVACQLADVPGADRESVRSVDAAQPGPRVRSLEIGLVDVAPRGEPAASSRDPFGYVTELPKQPSQVLPAKTDKTPQSPPSRISRRPRGLDFSPAYIGHLGPAGRPFAVFRHDGEVVLAEAGSTVDGAFVLRRVERLSVLVESKNNGTERLEVPLADD